MSPIQEATLGDSPFGTGANSDGWFVLHTTDAGWMTSDRFGAGVRFEGQHRLPEIGVHLRILQPGEPACLYHRESAQEDFFVISGECTLVVEEQERALRAGHFVHCPADTNHVFVGAGEGPCVMLMIGARPANLELCYPVSETAGKYGASVAEQTSDAATAYGDMGLRPTQPQWPLWNEE